MKIKKALLPLLIISLAPQLCSCWDMREINEIGLVVAVGIDKANAPARYSVTVQIANESAQGSNDSQESNKSQVWVGTADGDSLFDATRKLVSISSRRIMWAHNNVIIIGESMAREGIAPIVDFFTHNPELRMKTAVVVSKGNAKDYLSAKIGMEKPPGLSFILIERYRRLKAESVESHMLQVSASLRGKFSNPLISGINLKNAITQPPESGGSGSASNTVELSGAAVFKKDKMVGWLSPEESLGIAWIQNQTQDTVVTVADPERGNKSVSVETFNVKSKVKARIVNGIPQIQINISGAGDIAEEDGSTDQNINEVKKHIGLLVNKKIEEEVINSIAVIQKKYGVDVLNFAAIVHSQNDQEWESGLKDRWEDVFPMIPAVVTSDIVIESSTLNQEPFKIY